MGKRRSEGGGGFINLYCMSSCSQGPLLFWCCSSTRASRHYSPFHYYVLGLGAKGGWPVVDTYLRYGHKRKNIFC